ncbi:hypothetical protein GJ688_15640 [Heliobacillus mobilis]|uniref:Tetratricopeptide repeat protein n=1 Tax=Heliobacterium mobile TaxID=28064 RepID=A0A6I3SQD4_HELMO|nr:hypothetical protein [Heliobacterium mobile]MTV50397.1 hypothetical protein [Heliobacterium mobile]
MHNQRREIAPRINSWSAIRRGVSAIYSGTGYDYAVVDKARIQKGRELHHKALSGDKEAHRAAFDFFEQLYQEYPEDDVVAAYYADCLSLSSLFSQQTFAMFKNAVTASKLLDSSVNNQPDNHEIRMLRAYQSFRLPEGFFWRTMTAISDFEYLIEEYESGRTSLAEKQYHQLLFDLGCAYQRTQMTTEADHTWNRLLSLIPDSSYEKEIEKKRGLIPVEWEEKVNSLTAKEDLLQEGIRLHDLSVVGHSGAAKLAHQALSKAYELDPDDALIHAYLGSTNALTCLHGNDANALFFSAIYGLKTLTEALAKDPENPRIHLLRAYMNFSLPEVFFHTTETAIKEFLYLLDAYEKNPAILSPQEYWQMIDDLGVAYSRLDRDQEARQTWAKLADCPDRELASKRISSNME